MDYQSLVYTVDEALADMGFGKFQALVLVYAGLGWFAEATEMMLISFVGSEVKSEWGLSSSEESLLSTVVFAGMLVGAYAWGVVSDNYGRRQAFLFPPFILRGFLGTAVLTSGAGFLSTFSPNYILFLIFRFLVGIGLGSGSIFACWFLEFVPADNRGKWMVVFSSFWTFGTIFEAALAWIVMSRLSWRSLLAFSSLPSFVLLLFYSLAPESPRHLCAKGNTTDAHRILEKIAQLNKKKLPSGLLVSTRTDIQDEEFAPKEEVPSLSSTRKNNEEKKNCMSPTRKTQTETGRVVISFWKGTNGCVVQEIELTCPSTQHGV
ncbi:hypothetical protein ACJW30_07G026100 [Castanea mollissima]